MDTVSHVQETTHGGKTASTPIRVVSAGGSNGCATIVAGQARRNGDLLSNPRQVVNQWMSFTDGELTDHVRHLVRNQGPQTTQVWAQVRTNAVLAGRVRGTLSILRAQTRDSRDAAMWTAWISKAQQELSTPPPAPVAAPAVEEPVTEPVPTPAAEQKPAVEPPSAMESTLQFSLPDAPSRQQRPTSAAPAVMFQAPGQ